MLFRKQHSFKRQLCVGTGGGHGSWYSTYQKRMAPPFMEREFWRRKQTIIEQSHQQRSEAVTEGDPCHEENVTEAGQGRPGLRAGETCQVATGLPEAEASGKNPS